MDRPIASATPDAVSTFGQIDIYLFDQLQRGRIARGMRVLDAGCGGGRNLTYFLRAGFDCYAADADESAIAAVRQRAAELAPGTPHDHFRVESIERMTFDPACAEVVLASAVLHFARDDEQFAAMLQGAWHTLAPGGLFFCRLASTIGIESRVRHIAGRRFDLPDGSERYLVDEALLLEWTARLDGDLLDPLKTTVVQDQRAMTTWVLRKRS